MKEFGVYVTYKAFVIDKTYITAEDKEDAKQKIRDGYYDDILDSYIEQEEITNFDFFSEEEVEE